MLNKRFLQRISAFAEANGLLKQGEKHVVALSGGADSVALALALKELGHAVEAAHCNFHLRGEESDRDEQFCRKFCSEKGIELHVVHFDTLEFARLRKISVEMAARQLRYAYFERLVHDIGADDVCVAHHKDDSVETVLLNLIRGTGIHGLTGIKPRNGMVVRPLLCVSRRDIERALEEVGQGYVTDSTNLEDDVVRNKIRLDILPIMREINPSVGDSIAKTAARVADAVQTFDKAAENALNDIVEHGSFGRLVIQIGRLRACPSPENMLFVALQGCSFSPAQVERIYNALDAEPGRVFSSATHQLLVDRGRIIVEPLPEEEQRVMKMSEDGVYVLADGAKLRLQTVSAGPDFIVPKTRDACCADMSKLRMPLLVRTVEKGDRFRPFGMKGSKLVSDYLTDIKMNLFDKRRQLVVTDADGRVVWLVNQRSDERCRVTAATRTVLVLTFIS